MKILKILLPAILLSFLSSCIEINEDIVINKNGDGEWSMNMDMSKLLDIMQNYLGKEEMDKQFPNKKMDTAIFMKSLVDTSTTLTPEKKELLGQGKLHMDMNMNNKTLTTDMHFPFSNLSQLQEIYTALGDGSLGMGQLLKGLNKNDSSSVQQPQGPDMGQINMLYDFTSRPGYISRTVDQEKFKQLKENPQYAQMKQAGDMGMEVPYTLTIHLPKKVKKNNQHLRHAFARQKNGHY